MFEDLAQDFAATCELLLETLWAWKLEPDTVAKDRLWQQLVVLHEMHRDGFRRISEHLERETEDARILRAATLKRHRISSGKTD